MLTIKQIGILSLAKFLAVLYAGFGLLAGLFVSLFSIFGSMLAAFLAATPQLRNLAGASRGSMISWCSGLEQSSRFPFFMAYSVLLGG